MYFSFGCIRRQKNQKIKKEEVGRKKQRKRESRRKSNPLRIGHFALLFIIHRLVYDAPTLGERRFRRAGSYRERRKGRVNSGLGWSWELRMRWD